MESVSSDRLQYVVFIALSFVVLGCVGILYSSDRLLFQRFLGKANPLMVFSCVIVLGFILFYFLLAQEWFAIYEKENLKGLFYAAGIASLFGVIIILADTRIIFPDDMNVLFPKSLLYYPAFGFLAEILFHILPLTALFIFLNSILKNQSLESIIWICIIIVALLEPIFQMADMVSNQRPLWAVIYVGLHVYLISFFQLLIFIKYDFVSMYSFRLVYYTFWHIGWGYVRLRLLF